MQPAILQRIRRAKPDEHAEDDEELDECYSSQEVKLRHNCFAGF